MDVSAVLLIILIAVACLGFVMSVRYKKGQAASPEIAAWRRRVDAALEDGVLTLEEERRLANQAEKLFSVPGGMGKLQSEPAWMKLLQGAALRELINGELPKNRIDFQQFPFNLQRGEQLVWAFNDVSRYEPQTIRSTFRGGSMGLSLRVAKGVYVRPSTFSGESTRETRTVMAGRGALGITTKNIYFHDTSGGRSFRVPYQKIVSFAPYKKGIGFTQDLQTAKPQRFETSSEDGWFIYNLVMNLSQRE